MIYDDLPNLKNVIFHGDLLNNQRVHPPKMNIVDLDIQPC